MLIASSKKALTAAVDSGQPDSVDIVFLPHPDILQHKLLIITGPSQDQSPAC
jgi:hypothetical protein